MVTNDASELMREDRDESGQQRRQEGNPECQNQKEAEVSEPARAKAFAHEEVDEKVWAGDRTFKRSATTFLRLLAPLDIASIGGRGAVDKPFVGRAAVHSEVRVEVAQAHCCERDHCPIDCIAPPPGRVSENTNEACHIERREKIKINKKKRQQHVVIMLLVN